MRLRTLVAAVALCAGSCDCFNARAQYGTALYLTVDLNGNHVDQLDVTLEGVGTQMQPVSADGELDSPQTLRVLLSNALKETDVTITVLGTRSGLPVASGSNTAHVLLGLEVDVTVTLDMVVMSNDGGTDAGYVCSATNCPTGCCIDNHCEPGTDAGACGGLGSVCTVCPPGDQCKNGSCSSCLDNCSSGCCKNNVCTPPGAEQCGTAGGPCVTCNAFSANRCINGVCSCGNSGPCGPGLHCVGDLCLCDAMSCPNGCCEGNVCRTPSRDNRCGVGGADCLDCTQGGRTNICVMGVCTCGDNPQCDSSQQCVGSGAAATCVCNATSCGSGCCQGAVCHGQIPAACGTSGNVCATCDQDTANLCAPNGTCQCGTGMKCDADAGQRCSGSSGTATCVCDRLSCPNGCCVGNACVPGDTPAQCGAGGGSCSTCDAGCPGGVCSTACNPGSCAGGCCNGTNCIDAGFPSCGLSGPGTACRACDSRSDHCGSSGGCACGDGGACGSGQICSNGMCQCNQATCDGCCNGTRCETDAGVGACGLGGMTCSSCTAPESDTCAAGACGCGTGPKCGTGYHCVGGSCRCDPATCTGCCNGTATCVPFGATTVSACGKDGGICGVCAVTTTDNCSMGSCRCGPTAPCGPGLTCGADGGCQCTTGSGCTGCCVGGVQCVPLAQTMDNKCGNGGQTCAACSRGNLCGNDGICSCGENGPTCVAPQNCVTLPIVGGLGCL